MADYLTTFFPANESDPSSVARQADLKGAVSYIANELLENAMKFHDETANEPIRFGIHLFQDLIVLFSINFISKTNFAPFRQVLEELTSADPEELYVRHLEKLAEEEDSHASGLGLITIMNDYLAKLGWKLEDSVSHSEEIEVTTMVQLKI